VVLWFISLIFFSITGIFYKILVVDHDFEKARVIYEEEEKKEIYEYERIIIYVPDKELKKLEQKAVKIKKTDNMSDKIRMTFEEIQKNSDFEIVYKDDESQEQRVAYFDYGIRIINVYYEGKDLYLNFNHRLKSGIKTREQELMIIYSLVNSYTSFEEFDRVKILVNNQNIDMLKYYNIFGFFEKDLNI
jgi:uncharacterized membrane protein YgaE (UPF0421/DUF939 family)